MALVVSVNMENVVNLLDSYVLLHDSLSRLHELVDHIQVYVAVVCN